MGSGAKPPEAGEFSRIFVLKVHLTASYRKNGTAGCITCCPNNVVGQLLPLFPAPASASGSAFG